MSYSDRIDRRTPANEREQVVSMCDLVESWKQFRGKNVQDRLREVRRIQKLLEHADLIPEVPWTLENQIPTEKELARIKTGSMIPRIHALITMMCDFNHACTFCSRKARMQNMQSRNGQPVQLGYDDLMALFEQAAGGSAIDNPAIVQRFELDGGEPLGFWHGGDHGQFDLVDVLEQVYTRYREQPHKLSKVTVYTSLNWPEDKAQAWVERLAALPHVNLLISWPSFYPQYYTQMIPRDYDKAHTILTSLVAAGAQHNRGTWLAANVIPTQANQIGLRNTIYRLQKLGIPVMLQPLRREGNALRNNLQPLDEAEHMHLIIDLWYQSVMATGAFWRIETAFVKYMDACLVSRLFPREYAVRYPLGAIEFWNLIPDNIPHYDLRLRVDSSQIQHLWTVYPYRSTNISIPASLTRQPERLSLTELLRDVHQPVVEGEMNLEQLRHIYGDPQ